MAYYPEESTHDEWLRENSFFDQPSAAMGLKAGLAAQLESRMRVLGVDRHILSEKMQTSHAAVDRLLDGHTNLVSLNLLNRAAHALGCELRVELVPPPGVFPAEPAFRTTYGPLEYPPDASICWTAVVNPALNTAPDAAEPADSEPAAAVRSTDVLPAPEAATLCGRTPCCRSSCRSSLLEHERNAFRERGLELEATLGFLIGRPAEATREAQRLLELRAERDALRAALARLAAAA